MAALWPLRCGAGWQGGDDPGLVIAGSGQPAPPVAANGLVIALSEGDRKTRARLYVLDAATGKELYASVRKLPRMRRCLGVFRR
jgi:hypothetical protein